MAVSALEISNYIIVWSYSGIVSIPNSILCNGFQGIKINSVMLLPNKQQLVI